MTHARIESPPPSRQIVAHRPPSIAYHGVSVPHVPVPGADVRPPQSGPVGGWRNRVPSAESEIQSTVPLRARVPGTVRSGVRELGGRTVVMAASISGHHRGALTGADGATIAEAARMALDLRLPLVVVMSSSGSEVTDGIAALHGWGEAAAAVVACSGHVPVLAAVTGAAISGPALLLGLADLSVMTLDAFAFRVGTRRRGGIHRDPGVACTNSVARPCTPPPAGCAH